MMKLKSILDNSSIDSEVAQHPIIATLSNIDFKTLDKEHFIIFPQQLATSSDLDEEQMIFQTRNGQTWSCNVVGVLSNAEDELRINSRFSNQTNDADYFLRYMLQKVLHYNVIDNKFDSSAEHPYYNLLVFLFPYYLNEAMRKGLYKEYVRREYNDANVKGAIHVAQHIKVNVPFVGKVAYRTREFSYNNKLIQLFRHTIEKIQVDYNFLLMGNEDTVENVRAVKQATANYSRLERLDVLQNNILNPIKHGFFEEYSALQLLCIQILSDKKSSFGKSDNQIHGIIIDVAWLWEQYIWKVTGWNHYGRSRNLRTMHLFSTHSSPRYPDFVVGNVPIDTKYKKNLDTRNDYNQLTTYLHIMNSSTAEEMRAGFLQPTGEEHDVGYRKLGNLNGLGGELFTYKFFIPQQVDNYADFVQEILLIESELLNSIDRIGRGDS